MPQQNLISTSINNLEFKLAKFKAVYAQFPKATVNKYEEFQSKEVNKVYTAYEFNRSNWGVSVLPYCEVNYQYDNKSYIVKVSSKPLQSKLVYLYYSDGKYKITFSRLAFNLKQNSFKDAMFNDCRIEILNFIQANSQYSLDTKNLEPKLKNLLVFN